MYPSSSRVTYPKGGGIVQVHVTITVAFHFLLRVLAINDLLGQFGGLCGQFRRPLLDALFQFHAQRDQPAIRIGEFVVQRADCRFGLGQLLL